MARVHFLVLIIVTLMVCAAIFSGKFFSSHDGENHLIRIAHFYQLLTEGHVFPKWDSHLNNGKGYPLFVFAYPLPYYFTSLFKTLGTSSIDAFKISILIATFLSGLGMYKWIHLLTGKASSALMGAILFLMTPYRFVDIYVRAAFGEIIFLAIAPWLFYAWEKYHHSPDKKWIWGGGVVGGMMILSHPPLTVLAMTVAGIYLIARKISLKAVLLQGVIAAVISAFYWVPMVWLSNDLVGFTQLQNAAVHIVPFRHLIYSPWGFGFSDPGAPGSMSFQVGIANWLVLLLSPVLIRKKQWVGVGLVIVIASSLLLTSSNIRGIWNSHLAQFFQFPWRLLIIPLICIPVIAGMEVSILPRWGKIVGVVLVVCAIYTNRNHIRINQEVFQWANEEYFLRSDTTGTATPYEFMPKDVEKFHKKVQIIP